MPILTQKALVLAKVETTSGIDANPTAAANAILVTNPNVGFQPNEIVRNFARPDFSQYPSIMGRKLSTVQFDVEIAGSGTAGTTPRWATLLQGCGMASSSITQGTAVTIAASTGATRSSNDVTITTTTAHGFSVGDEITIAGVTDASFDGTFIVASVPTSTEFTYFQQAADASSGGGTATGGPTSGGTRFLPITDNMPTITLYIYYDGLLHKMTGCMGTFSLQADAGTIGKFTFNFTGNYNQPVDSSYPSPVFDNVVPPQVELAELTFGGNTALVIQQFKMDIGNKISPRQDINSANGYRGVRITGRDPKGGINPEVELQSLDPVWTDASNVNLKTLACNFGNTDGNRVVIAAPKVQVSGISYGDRDGLRVYDLALAFRRNAGNDEFSITLE